MKRLKHFFTKLQLLFFNRATIDDIWINSYSNGYPGPFPSKAQDIGGVSSLGYIDRLVAYTINDYMTRKHRELVGKYEVLEWAFHWRQSRTEAVLKIKIKITKD